MYQNFLYLYFNIQNTLKYCNIFQQWGIVDMPSPRDADASKNIHIDHEKNVKKIKKPWHPQYLDLKYF